VRRTGLALVLPAYISLKTSLQKRRRHGQWLFSNLFYLTFEFRRLKRKAPILESSEEEQEQSPPKKKTAAVRARPSATKEKVKKRKDDEDFEMEPPVASDLEADEKPGKRKLTTKGSSSGVKVAQTPVISSEGNRPVIKVMNPPKKFECVSCFTFSIPMNINSFVNSWAAKKTARLAGPTAHGSKEVPDGVPDALLGLSLVFTGELTSFSRDEAIDLAKRFGAQVSAFDHGLLVVLTFVTAELCYNRPVKPIS
jgi:replication factor C subunit 1